MNNLPGGFSIIGYALIAFALFVVGLILFSKEIPVKSYYELLIERLESDQEVPVPCKSHTEMLALTGQLNKIKPGIESKLEWHYDPIFNSYFIRIEVRDI